MVGAVILFSIGFFFLGIFGAVALMERRMAKKTMTKILEECEELYKKDYPETHNWNPAIKYETACDIIMKLCNPHDSSPNSCTRQATRYTTTSKWNAPTC